MARPLRVVMPALTYVPGAMGGSETYARALVAALDERDDVELSVIVSRSAAGALGAKSEYAVRSVVGGPSMLSRLRAVVRGVLGDRTSRALMRGADVVHYPFTVPVPLPPRGVPWLTTLHDVQHRDLPGMSSAPDRLYRALAYDIAAQRATRVITVSDFCRRRISGALRIPAERIDVAHNGVDLQRFHQSEVPREPFVFYPATAWAHKNHGRLIEAMELVRVTRPELKLVLTGGRRFALGSLPDWVEHRGYVAQADLSELYRSAACLAYPSSYEGFGLPPLEAMASGCPVAAARSGAIPEVCGEAAVLFDSEDVRAIAAGISTALALQDRLRDLGTERVRHLDWFASADAHVRSFRAAAGH